ncbi:MAG: hypothetical protein AAFX87_01880 [Bacteroidota bacterium]
MISEECEDIIVKLFRKCKWLIFNNKMSSAMIGLKEMIDKFFLTQFILILCVHMVYAQGNVAPTSSVSISSTFQTGNYTAGDLIDGGTNSSDWSTGWYANFFNSSNPQSATFDFGGSPVVIDSYALFGHSDATVRPPGHRLEARNTTSDPWTILNSSSAKISEGENTFSFSNSTSYRYYRIIMTDNGGSSGTAGFQEVELFTGVLPIRLIDFEVVDALEGAELRWWTAQEIDNDFFTIERSIDAALWLVVDTVDGVGNSESIQEYAYTDRSVRRSLYYYRLKQTDYDGTFTYSPVEAIEIQSNTKLRISPNPARLTETIYIQLDTDFSADDYTITMTSVTGVEYELEGVISTQEGSYMTIDLSLLPLTDGIYLLKMVGADQISTRRIYLSP